MIIKDKNLFTGLLIATILVFPFCADPAHGAGSPQSETVIISGKVSDYDGNLLDSVYVVAMHADFSPAKSTHTDAEGYYQLELEKGKYMALLAVRMHEYPRFSELAPEDQRLEFWAWNFIAHSDTTFNMQYHRLEVYGLNVFRIHGATPGYTIYCRPMSLTRLFNGMEDIAPEPDELSVTVRINGIETKVNMKQKVEEFLPEGKLFGYLLHVNLPGEYSKKPYDVFTVFMEDKQTGDKGEAAYFKEKDGYH